MSRKLDRAMAARDRWHGRLSRVVQPRDRALPPRDLRRLVDRWDRGESGGPGVLTRGGLDTRRLG